MEFLGRNVRRVNLCLTPSPTQPRTSAARRTNFFGDPGPVSQVATGKSRPLLSLVNPCLTPSPTQPRTSAARPTELFGDPTPATRSLSPGRLSQLQEGTRGKSAPLFRFLRAYANLKMDPSGFASQSPFRTQAQVDEYNPTAPTPFVYVHIRNLHGIIESKYYVPLPRPSLDEVRARAVGPQAARYLVTHGYTAESVDIVIRAREATVTASASQFALQLSAHGMAFEEATYLHALFEL